MGLEVCEATTVTLPATTTKETVMMVAAVPQCAGTRTEAVTTTKNEKSTTTKDVKSTTKTNAKSTTTKDVKSTTTKNVKSTTTKSVKTVKTTSSEESNIDDQANKALNQGVISSAFYITVLCIVFSSINL